MDIFEVGGVSILVAFAAGLLSCASPCVLPLVPAYLGYLTGAAIDSTTRAPVAAGAGPGAASIALGGGPPAGAAGPSPLPHPGAFVSRFSPGFFIFWASLGLVGLFPFRGG